MRLYPCPRILLIVILSEVVSLKAIVVQDYCAHYRLHCDATPLTKDPANQVLVSLSSVLEPMSVTLATDLLWIRP
jgi:hypothetical protein